MLSLLLLNCYYEHEHQDQRHYDQMEFTDYHVSPKQMDVSLGVPKKGMENPAKLNDLGVPHPWKPPK